MKDIRQRTIEDMKLAISAEMIPALVEAVKNINVVVARNLMRGVKPKNIGHVTEIR